MAFKISITGEDSFANEGEKVAFERHFSQEVHAFIDRLATRPNVSVVKWDISVDTLDDEVFDAAPAKSKK